jgi:hypothetical protein
MEKKISKERALIKKSNPLVMSASEGILSFSQHLSATKEGRQKYAQNINNRE